MALAPGEARKDLSADALFQVLRSHFGSLPDHRLGEVEFPLHDALMSAFAMLSLKDPSLLAFDSAAATPTTTSAPSMGSIASPPTPRCGPFLIRSIPQTCEPRFARSSVASNAARRIERF